MARIRSACRARRIRVYVNIGMFSEYWLTRHNRLIGLDAAGSRSRFPMRASIPFSGARPKNGWRTSRRSSGRLQPFHLADAPGGAAYLTTDAGGHEPRPAGLRGELRRLSLEQAAARRNRSAFRRRQGWFRAAVAQAGFSREQFPLEREALSDSTKIKTNSARAFGTNAKAGPRLGQLLFADLQGPVAAPTSSSFTILSMKRSRSSSSRRKRTPGPGYYRVPSLVSLWSSAPFLHNNALGKFTGDPSVAGRLRPSTTPRRNSSGRRNGSAKLPSGARRTNATCTSRKEFVPKALQALADADGYFKLGPIPKGTPINLLANLEPDFGAAGRAEMKI